MRLHVGCAMWTHTPWQGRFLPHPLPPGERLKAYASWCTAVEGNTTFYATPSRATTQSWARQTPDDFRFLAKLPRAITHEKRFHAIEADLRVFLDAVEPLGPRAETLWIQLPPAFAPADVAALGSFLRRLPDSHSAAVEVRHRAFFEDPRAISDLERVLAGAGAEWVPFDTTVLFDEPPQTAAEHEAWSKKPRVPRRTRALTARPIVRYIGRDDVAATVRWWRPWLDVVEGWLREGRSPTVFLHTPDNAEALQLARQFHHDVQIRIPSLEPLPEPLPKEPLTLF